MGVEAYSGLGAGAAGLGVEAYSGLGAGAAGCGCAPILNLAALASNSYVPALIYILQYIQADFELIAITSMLQDLFLVHLLLGRLSIWTLRCPMASSSSTETRVSIGRQRTIRTILSSYIRPIGCVVVDCERKIEFV